MGAAGTSQAGTAAYFQERIAVRESGCVEWTGTLSDDGYGRMLVGYKAHGRPIRRYAHVWSFEMWVGPVPPGLELDHLCRNRACVNPAHLEPVTRMVNVHRGVLPALMRTRALHPTRPLLAFCARGHEMAGANVGRNEKRRWCRECKRLTAAQRRSA